MLAVVTESPSPDRCARLVSIAVGIGTTVGWEQVMLRQACLTLKIILVSVVRTLVFSSGPASTLHACCRLILRNCRQHYRQAHLRVHAEQANLLRRRFTQKQQTEIGKAFFFLKTSKAFFMTDDFQSSQSTVNGRGYPAAHLQTDNS